MLELLNVSYRNILHDISVTWNAGVIGVIGPNGAGKSTLLKLAAGIDRPDEGDVRLSGQSVSRVSSKLRAQRLAYLPQQLPDDVIFTVREFVEMGRYPYRRATGTLTRDCNAAIDLAMKRMHLQDLATVPMGQLSGGERQRVAIARCLAQQTRILILDEPISNLDLYYQINILGLLRELAAEGYLVVLAIHHLELAAQYCDELLLLHEGRVHKAGAVRDVLQPAVVGRVFQMDVRLFQDPYDDSLRLSFSTH